MESRERVMLALGHQRPDRVPINFRGVPRVVETVSQALGTDYEGLLQHWGVDFREIIPPYIGPSFAAREDGAEVDYWGVGRSLVEHADGGRDVMVSYSPLKDATTVEDVETRRTIDVLGENGGYFFSPAHRFQADTPLENIFAAFDTAVEYGRY